MNCHIVFFRHDLSPYMFLGGSFMPFGALLWPLGLTYAPPLKRVPPSYVCAPWALLSSLRLIYVPWGLIYGPWGSFMPLGAKCACFHSCIRPPRRAHPPSGVRPLPPVRAPPQAFAPPLSHAHPSLPFVPSPPPSAPP
jgi:hypothetical protein